MFCVKCPFYFARGYLHTYNVFDKRYSFIFVNLNGCGAFLTDEFVTILCSYLRYSSQLQYIHLKICITYFHLFVHS
jgi:hypothetical protein